MMFLHRDYSLQFHMAFPVSFWYLAFNEPHLPPTPPR